MLQYPWPRNLNDHESRLFPVVPRNQVAEILAEVQEERRHDNFGPLAASAIRLSLRPEEFKELDWRLSKDRIAVHQAGDTAVHLMDDAGLPLGINVVIAHVDEQQYPHRASVSFDFVASDFDRAISNEPNSQLFPKSVTRTLGCRALVFDGFESLRIFSEIPEYTDDPALQKGIAAQVERNFAEHRTGDSIEQLCAGFFHAYIQDGELLRGGEYMTLLDFAEAAHASGRYGERSSGKHSGKSAFTVIAKYLAASHLVEGDQRSALARQARTQYSRVVSALGSDSYYFVSEASAFSDKNFDLRRYQLLFSTQVLVDLYEHIIVGDVTIPGLGPTGKKVLSYALYDRDMEEDKRADHFGPDGKKIRRFKRREFDDQGFPLRPLHS